VRAGVRRRSNKKGEVMAADSAGLIDYSRYEALKLDKDNGIMTITLSNPGKRNAMTPRMGEELAVIWSDLWIDREVKVVILTGEGEDFCSGADVSGLSERAKVPRASNPINTNTYLAKRHVYGIMDLEKPVIAKIRGVAYGAGINMALACDMAFAAEGARLCDSHVKAGMVAGDGGVLLWPLLIGMRKAKEYLMTGELIPAELADELGLINRCVPDAELDQVVAEMAGKLMALPPHAVNYTKMSLNAAMRQMTGAFFNDTATTEIYTMGMDDFKEATSAFVEKRRGEFKGT
jgi:enoyl-CoA hydratase